MRKLFFLLVFGLIVVSTENLFAQQLSSSAKISLITASPGDELYSIFGHSALRIRDDSLGIDWVYGYGTFDFDTPNFYMKFMRGKLNYSLSISDFDRFYDTYVYEKRSLYEQVLNLSQERRQIVFDKLQENYLPENRYYKYDFFFDNCATRIGDITKVALGDSLDYGSEHVRGEQSFRDLIDIYLVKMPWADYGIDILLGLPTDAVAESTEYMFLPDYVDSVFQGSTIIRVGEKQDLVASRSVILDMKAQQNYKPSAFRPYHLNVLILLGSLFITVLGFKKNKRFGWLDKLLFNATGLIGWLIVFLWFFTDHIATKGNINLLWAWPVFFPLFFFIFNDRLKVLRKYVFVLFSITCFAMLIFWNNFPQNLHDALIWLILALVIRSIYNLIFDSKLKKTSYETDM